MKILITGGAGFIGSHLVDALVKAQNEVTVIDKMENYVTYKNPSAKYIVSDLHDSNDTNRLIRNFDVVFHLASTYSVLGSSKDPKHDFENNLLLTFNVLDAMRKNDVKKIVFTSTSAVYGIQKKFPIKEDTASLFNIPISNYAVSKLASETYIHSFFNLYGIEGLILRMANVVGPGSNHGIIPDIVRKIKNNPRKLDVLGNGKQRKSYIHVSDCIDAILLASDKFNRFDIFNIGYADWISVTEIVSLICKEMDVKPEIVFSGGDGGWPGDVPEFLLDASKLRNLGWKPAMNTTEAIVDAVKWAKKEKNL